MALTDLLTANLNSYLIPDAGTNLKLESRRLVAPLQAIRSDSRGPARPDARRAAGSPQRRPRWAAVTGLTRIDMLLAAGRIWQAIADARRSRAELIVVKQ
jgi:hypothetical protein